MLVLFIRSVLIYIFVFIIIRLTGKRQLSDLQPFDLVITLLIADLASDPASDVSMPLLHGIIPILALFLMQKLIAFLVLRSEKIRRLACGHSLILVEKGKVVEKTLRSASYTLNDLIAQLRSQEVYELRQVEYAILETNGMLSVIKTGLEQQPTYEDMGIEPPKVGLPYYIVEDGLLHRGALRASGLDENWFNKKLRYLGYKNATEILMMCVNADGTVHVQAKETKGGKVHVLPGGND